MRFVPYRLITALAVSLLTFSASCDNNKEDNSLLTLLPVLASPDCPDITLPAGATLVKKGGLFVGGNGYCYYLLELQYDDHKPSYAMWIPPLVSGPRPAVLLTCPYDYISWNGDDIPLGSAKSMRDYIGGATLFLINNIGVLYVYERFYTEDDIQNDVDDTVAGYRFLKDSGFVDATRVGTWGGSWGGFEALYGAAYSSDGGGMVPRAGVAFYPLSDFNDEVDYIELAASGLPNSIPDITDDTKRTLFQDFFAPYLTRIRATTDFSGFTNWTGDNLVGRLATPFVVVHDEWDTLVPFEQSVYLAVNSTLPGKVTPLFFYQDTDRDLNELPWGWGHGELREFKLDDTPPPADGVIYGMSNTMASAYLLTRLATPDQTQIIIGYDPNALADFIIYLRYQNCSTTNIVGWAAQLLQDCADSRIVALNMLEANTFTTGAEMIAGAFAAADWGGPAYRNPATVYGALDAGLPAACP